MITGMAIARLRLNTQAMHWRLGLAGIALAMLGYGVSWLALLFLPDVPTALRESPGLLWDLDCPWSLSVAAPHSETTFSILGNTGCAMIVLAACWLAMDSLPRLRKMFWPVVAVSSMSLTVYVLHIVGIAYLLRVMGIDSAGEDGSLSMLLGFVVATSTFAVLWLRAFQRGPMEVLMGRITDLARHIL